MGLCIPRNITGYLYTYVSTQHLILVEGILIYVWEVTGHYIRLNRFIRGEVTLYDGKKDKVHYTYVIFKEKWTIV
jgi:hypothetical protein